MHMLYLTHVSRVAVLFCRLVVVTGVPGAVVSYTVPALETYVWDVVDYM